MRSGGEIKKWNKEAVLKFTTLNHISGRAFKVFN